MQISHDPVGFFKGVRVASGMNLTIKLLNWNYSRLLYDFHLLGVRL